MGWQRRITLPSCLRKPNTTIVFFTSDKKLCLLRYRNARGSHIYILPSGSIATLLSTISLAKLAADGFTPLAVVETSANNFQAWLKHTTVLLKLLGPSRLRHWLHATTPSPVLRTGEGSELPDLSLERFRMAAKYADRPAAADIAFCVCGVRKWHG